MYNNPFRLAFHDNRLQNSNRQTDRQKKIDKHKQTDRLREGERYQESEEQFKKKLNHELHCKKQTTKKKRRKKKKKKEKEVILMKMHENKQSLILSRIFNNTQWLMKNLKMKSRLAR